MSRNAEDCENSGLLPQLESEPEVEQIGEAPEEVPFEIPQKWKWVKLKTLFSTITSGKNTVCAKRKAQKVEWGVIKTTAIQKGLFLQDENKVLPKTFKFPAECQIHDGDFLMTKAGPINRVGICCVAKNITNKIILSGHTIRLSLLAEFVLGDFLVHVLHAPQIRHDFLSFMSGMAQSQVNLKHKTLGNLLIPLPPINEQRRIVARLNELLPLVDDFGEAQEAFDVAQTEFPDKLKASLLQAAIEGKLVPQLESEPEVEQIGNAPEEVPFEIPDKWKWTKLGIVACIVRGGSPRPIKNYLTTLLRDRLVSRRNDKKVPAPSEKGKVDEK